MIKRLTFLSLFTLTIIIFSCSSQKYFHDISSLDRQKELKKNHSGNVVSNIANGIISIFTSAVFNIEAGWYPSEQEFKKIKLINPSTDTIYVNMLTDVYWDEENYCDFMDIRLPPKTDCKVLVPVNANYNLYFSNTIENDDDEMLEIFTTNLKKVSLYPGLTLLNDTVNLNR
ncbi:MAG: hypothetical protein L3J54_11960 [Draconibacterium sp.]|nr:hypothetical protein [Draconibacterium sp.]